MSGTWFINNSFIHQEVAFHDLELACVFVKTDPILYKGDQLKLRIFLKLLQNWDAINENSTQRFAN